MVSAAARTGAVAPSAPQSRQEDPVIRWALLEPVIAPTVLDGRGAPHETAWLLPDGAAGSATTTAVSCTPLLAHIARGAPGVVRLYSVG
jgi:hypothetical protein